MNDIKELQKDIAEFNNAEVIEIKKTYNANYKGNQNDLNKFMSQIAYLDYVRSTKKNKRQTVKKEYNNNKNAHEIHAILEKQQFLKPWGRLDNYCKKIKIKEFINLLITKGQLDKNFDFYYKDLINLLEKKKLNSKKEILYDSEKGEILKIFKYS